MNKFFVIYQPWTESYYIADEDIVKCIQCNIESDYYKSVGVENPIIHEADLLNSILK